jgi:hypothetical protein
MRKSVENSTEACKAFRDQGMRQTSLRLSNSLIACVLLLALRNWRCPYSLGRVLYDYRYTFFLYI